LGPKFYQRIERKNQYWLETFFGKNYFILAFILINNIIRIQKTKIPKNLTLAD